MTTVSLPPFTLDVRERVEIAGTPAAMAAIGQPYSFTPTVSNGFEPFSFALEGDLPPDFTFDPETGTVASDEVGFSGLIGDIEISVTDDLGMTAALPAASILCMPQAAFDASESYFDRMSAAPSLDVVKVISRFVYDLFIADIWDDLEVCQIMPGGVFANAALNIKGDTKNLSANGTISADPWGLTGDGSTGYLTGWGAPNSMALYSQDSAHVSFFIAKQGNGQYHWGRAGSNVNFLADCGVNQIAARVNANETDRWSVVNALGLTTLVRPDSASEVAYKNGVSLGTVSRASSALSNQAQTLLRRGSNYSTDTLAMAFIGAAIAAEQAAALSEACHRFMAAFGWGLPALETSELSPLSYISLPDLLGSEPGKGFTCTGLTSNNTDDTWWLGNDGRGAPGDTTHDGSIVRLSADFSTVVSNFLLADYEADLGFTTGTHSVQGVTIDTTDDTIFALANHTTGANTVVLHIEKDGTYLGHFGVPQSASGIAYDAVEDALLVPGSGGFNLRDKSTGTVIGVNTSTGPGIDQLSFLDDGRLLVMQDGSPANIGVYERKPEYGIWYRTKTINVPAAASIEGGAVRSGILYINNDAYFHQTGRRLNEVVTFDGSGI